MSFESSKIAWSQPSWQINPGLFTRSYRCITEIRTVPHASVSHKLDLMEFGVEGYFTPHNESWESGFISCTLSMFEVCNLPWQEKLSHPSKYSKTTLHSTLAHTGNRPNFTARTIFSFLHSPHRCVNRHKQWNRHELFNVLKTPKTHEPDAPPLIYTKHPSSCSNWQEQEGNGFGRWDVISEKTWLTVLNILRTRQKQGHKKY